MKCAFDLLARCVIDACSLAPMDGDDPVKTRQYAHRAWRKVSYLQKSDWQNLFDARYDPGANVFARGQDLLRFHNLLAHVVPGFHSRVWKVGPSTSPLQENAEQKSAPPTPKCKGLPPRRNVSHDQNPNLGSRGHTPRLEPSASIAQASSSCMFIRPHTYETFAC